MNDPAIVALVLISAGVAVGGWRLVRASRWRRMRRTAAMLGLEPSRAADLPAFEALRRLGPFAGCGRARGPAYRGRSEGAELVLMELETGGRAPDPVAVIDVAEHSDRAPVFVLAPRAAGDAEPSVGFARGSRFDELYALSGGDEESLGTLFCDRVRRFFERAENLGWVIASDGSWLAISVWPLGERRRRLDPKHLAGFVEDARLVHRVLRGGVAVPSVRRRAAAAG